MNKKNVSPAVVIDSKNILRQATTIPMFMRKFLPVDNALKV